MRFIACSLSALFLLGACSSGETPTTANPTKTDTDGAVQRMRGMYSHIADAGWFVDCESGRRMAVAQEGDNAALESAYLSASAEPGKSLVVNVDGKIEQRMPMEGQGPNPTLVVEKFVDVESTTKCDDSTAVSLSLENTRWRLTSLGDAPVKMENSRNEPHVVLSSAQHKATGNGGCNRFFGSYSLDGDRLKFGALAATKMACMQTMNLESDFHAALAAASQWRIEGKNLELLNDSGKVLARFEATPLKEEGAPLRQQWL